MIKPGIGDIVEIEWLDSGMGSEGVEGQHAARLKFGLTFGRVAFVGRDPELCARMCRERHKCEYVELVMCTNGEGDERADLAGIWWESVTRWKRLINRRTSK